LAHNVIAGYLGAIATLPVLSTNGSCATCFTVE
jgi:hypothetical protein